jgi:hypothetical protein
MSGSPIYIEGKLLGAVAFAWEFAKDPIAGVTPFQQMVQYVRANDRRIAAEAKDRDGAQQEPVRAARWDGPEPLLIAGLATDEVFGANRTPSPLAGGTVAGMRAIATPLAASGFSPRALALLSERFEPLGMAPMAGGAAPEQVVRAEGNKPLAPGAPLSIAMVTGDFDLSGIGTVTHVEGDRVYGFGHPMFSLGTCEFPMMTGFIHTVNPRASVSMKMGSPLKVVGVIDTDVSTGVAGRLGLKPDMIPMSVRVKTGPYSEPHTYRVQIVREPNLLPNLVMAVLTNAIDTEGNLPEELTATIQATIQIKGHEPIVLSDTASGPRYTGPMGAAALFSPIAAIINILVRNPMAPIRIESIACETEISPGRTVASIESVRLVSDRLEPGGRLRAFATLKPFKGERQTFEVALALPDDLEEGTYEASVCDLNNSLRRRFRNEPALLEPRDLEGVFESIRSQTRPRRTVVYLHVPLPDRGLAVKGQALPNLPGSVRAVFSNGRQSQEPQVRTDLIAVAETPYVVEGVHTLKFTVVKDTGYATR